MLAKVQCTTSASAVRGRKTLVQRSDIASLVQFSAEAFCTSLLSTIFVNLFESLAIFAFLLTTYTIFLLDIWVWATLHHVIRFYRFEMPRFLH